MKIICRNLFFAVISVIVCGGCALRLTPEPPDTEQPKIKQAYQIGRASFYSNSLQGRPTANGEPYDAQLLTAAHLTFPFGTMLRVTNLRNGESVIVRVNDRGPYHGDRVLDLSYAAAMTLRFIDAGVALVQIDVLP